MRWRALLIVSLGVNLAFAVTLLVQHRRTQDTIARLSGAESLFITNQVKTNVVIRRQFFTWREVESPDYAVYIANLRDIGCPESTIRDIIVADVNQLYAERRINEVLTADQQWWRSDLDPAAATQAANEQLRALDQERRALLTRLLGPNWEVVEPDLTVARAARAGLTLNGPMLGTLSPEVKRAVEEISAQSAERIQAYLDAQRLAGRKPDPAEMARLRQQTRNELAKVLNPAQLEEFLLRFSDSAQQWRASLGELKYFNATPDEFRRLFRATDPIDQQINLLASATDPESVERRQALQRQRDNAIKLALGETRYEEYRRLQDPAYRDAVTAANAAGAPGTAPVLYQLGLATDAERERIKLDPTLTDSQREIELKKLELELMKAKTLAEGGQLPPEPPPPPTPPTRQAHVMKPGETVDMLAFYYGIPVSDIFRANRNVDFSKLKPGDTIQVPLP